MKRRTKIYICALILGVSGMFITGCGKKEEKTLYEHGLDLAETIVEAAEAEEFWDIFGVKGEEFLGRLEDIRDGKYKKPKKVYALTISHEGLSNMLEAVDAQDMPESLQSLLENRMFGSLPNQLNAKMGSNAMVISSVLNATKTFVCDKLESNCMYIYVYKKGTPISVTFIKGEDGSVSASATFLMSEDLVEDLEEILEDMEFYDELGIEIEEMDVE